MSGSLVEQTPRCGDGSWSSRPRLPRIEQLPRRLAVGVATPSDTPVRGVGAEVFFVTRDGVPPRASFLTSLGRLGVERARSNRRPIGSGPLRQDETRRC